MEDERSAVPASASYALPLVVATRVPERLTGPPRLEGERVPHRGDVGRELNLRFALLLTVVVGCSAVLALFLRHSGFVGTDFISLREAQGGLSLDYLTRPVFDHFVPGHRLVNWLIQSVAPLDFRLPVAVSVACFAATLLVLHRLLAELFRGPRLALLLLTLFFGVSTVHVTTAQWWASSLSRLPGGLFILLAILLHLRFRRTGRIGLHVASVAAVAGALMFSEDGVLVPVFLVGLRVLVLNPDEPLGEAVKGALREWKIWLSYLLPIAFTLLGSTSQTNRLYDFQALGHLAQYLAAAWFHAFVPVVFGLFVNEGPVSGGELAAAVTAQVLLIAVVVWSVRRRRSAWRAWAFFVLGFLATQVPVGLVRTDFYQPELVAHSYRYYSVAIALFTIALGAALLPVRAAVRHRPLSLVAGGQVRAPITRSRIALVATVGTAYLAASLWTSVRVMRELYGHRAGPYLETLKQELRRADEEPGSFALLDGELPPFMMERVFAPNNRVGAILPLFERGYRLSTTAPELYRVGAEGRLERVTFTPRLGGSAAELLITNALGAVEYDALWVEDGRMCVRGTGEAEGAVIGYQLPTVLPPGEWYLRVRYRSPRQEIAHVLTNPGGTFVSTVDPALPILPQRTEAVVALGSGGFSHVLIVMQPRHVLCVEELTVGLVESRGT